MRKAVAITQIIEYTEWIGPCAATQASFLVVWKQCVTHSFYGQIIISCPNLVTRNHLSRLSWSPRVPHGCPHEGRGARRRDSTEDYANISKSVYRTDSLAGSLGWQSGKHILGLPHAALSSASLPYPLKSLGPGSWSWVEELAPFPRADRFAFS